MHAVVDRVGLSRSSIYARQRSGDFPRAVSIGPRAVGYLEREVEAWIKRACHHREAARP
ncbi:AlpA family phage regulatory protein [Variovorax sp.]|uniref:helix-turn-helix transcriptional regulator n=1 Tax=Variovorax sp. TaxID=1871043 RepID=UPI0025DA476E|nr:AlpA family phage regulatory protein [Variovorax sp.]